MAHDELRDFRPETHFTPEKGWTNDPNGLIRRNGVWHLFAQHNPHAPVWNPAMHWLHAVSMDLLTWEELGIALAPDDKLGSIFSGSAVTDTGNTSGLGGVPDPVICMYTSHGEYEQQSIAVSDDGCHFTPYSGNPVIPNTELKDFRDPKVFRNEILNCWSAVIAAGDHVEFYASDDLIRWRKTGEFGREENTLGGLFECPDLLPLRAPDGTTCWVLMASMFLDLNFGGNRAQYFIGDFDGYTFRRTVLSPSPLMVDAGYDAYAQVTFSGIGDSLMMGWAANPGYAGDVPTGGFRGIMTYARKLTLVPTQYGLRLAALPVVPFYDPEPHPAIPQPDTGAFLKAPPKAEAELNGELFCVKVETDGPFTLMLCNDLGDVLKVTLDNVGQFVVDRSEAGIRDFSGLYASGLMSVTKTPRLLDGSVSLRLYFDHMIAEIFADEGTFAHTSLVFPRAPYTKAVLLGEGTLWV